MKFEIPTKCPSCASDLVMIKDQLFCQNKAECPAQNARAVEHYCKVMKIKGLAAKRIETLGLERISDIYELTEQFIESQLGTKTAQNLMSEINNSKNTEFETFIAAMGIKLIGPAAGSKLASVINSVEDINQQSCKQAGLGDKATVNLLEWKKNYLPPPVSFTTKKEEKVIEDIKGVVCISGKLTGYTKKQAETLLNEAGYEVKSTVTKEVTILLSEETGSAKYKKATELGLKIITNIGEMITNG